MSKDARHEYFNRAVEREQNREACIDGWGKFLLEVEGSVCEQIKRLVVTSRWHGIRKGVRSFFVQRNGGFEVLDPSLIICGETKFWISLALHQGIHSINRKSHAGKL